MGLILLFLALIVLCCLKTKNDDVMTDRAFSKKICLKKKFCNRKKMDVFFSKRSPAVYILTYCGNQGKRDNQISGDSNGEIFKIML